MFVLCLNSAFVFGDSVLRSFNQVNIVILSHFHEFFFCYLWLLMSTY